jgi:hypothetical protein
VPNATRIESNASEIDMEKRHLKFLTYKIAAYAMRMESKTRGMNLDKSSEFLQQ